MSSQTIRRETSATRTTEVVESGRSRIIPPSPPTTALPWKNNLKNTIRQWAEEKYALAWVENENSVRKFRGRKLISFFTRGARMSSKKAPAVTHPKFEMRSGRPSSHTVRPLSLKWPKLEIAAQISPSSVFSGDSPLFLPNLLLTGYLYDGNMFAWFCPVSLGLEPFLTLFLGTPFWRYDSFVLDPFAFFFRFGLLFPR